MRFCPKQLTIPLSMLLILSSFSSWAVSDASGATLFRYKNDQGVVVINSSIPAEYAQNGYEVITPGGDVLKVVAPAPSQADIAQAEKERELIAYYEQLKLRFSGIEDIERAKQRKLANINTNVTILDSTISNLQIKIDELIGRAAEFERSGRAVPQNLLDQLADTRTELSISKKLLRNRQQEYQETVDKYDDDIRAFVQGEALANQRQASHP